LKFDGGREGNEGREKWSGMRGAVILGKGRRRGV